MVPMIGGGPKGRQTLSAFESHWRGVPVVAVLGGPVGVAVGVVAVAVGVVGGPVGVVPVAVGVVTPELVVVAVAVGVVGMTVGVVGVAVGVVGVAVGVVGIAVGVVAVVHAQQSSVESKVGKVALSQPSLTHIRLPKQSVSLSQSPWPSPH